MLEKNSMSTEVLNLMESSLHIEKNIVSKFQLFFFWKKKLLEVTRSGKFPMEIPNGKRKSLMKSLIKKTYGEP